MRGELSIAQPELSNEVLLPGSDFPAPEPPDVRCAGAGDVCAGAGCGLTGGGLTGDGEGGTGADTGTAGVATATVGVLGAADASAACEAPDVVGAVFANCACAGRAAAVTIAATGGELARRTGIAGPAEAVEMLDASCSRGVPAGRSERPNS